MVFVAQKNNIIKAGYNATCPATLGSGMPLVVGQVT